MILKFERIENRENLNVDFYEYSSEDNLLFKQIPFFLEKQEILSEDKKSLTKISKYTVNTYDDIEAIFHNEKLQNLNLKVASYCARSSISRSTLKIDVIDNDTIYQSWSFPEIP